MLMDQIKIKQLDAYQTELKKSQDDLVLAYMPALRAMAFRLKSRLPSTIDVSDLISSGVTAMVQLSKSYDKELNDNFWGYAKQRVYGAMLDFLRTLDPISRADRKLAKAVDSEINLYFCEHETEPSDEYIAKRLNESVERVAEARSFSDIAAVMPLDEQYALFSDDDSTQLKVEKDELISIIQSILEEFCERDRLVIQLFYFEELKLHEISEILNISQSRISQIHKKLVEQIRERLGF